MSQILLSSAAKVATATHQPRCAYKQQTTHRTSWLQLDKFDKDRLWAQLRETHLGILISDDDEDEDDDGEEDDDDEDDEEGGISGFDDGQRVCALTNRENKSGCTGEGDEDLLFAIK